MSLITFKNKPDTTTPLNANNLNSNFTECYNIVDSGISNNSNYIKFSDGTMICYGSKTGTDTLVDYWNQFKRTQPIEVTFPQTFFSSPSVLITPYGGGIASLSATIESVSSTKCEVQIYKPNDATNTSYNFSYIAIGRWKE